MEILNKLENKFSEIFEDLKELNEYIYKNPELGRKEFKACEAHKNLLKKYGFDIEENYIGIPTAYLAKYSSGKKGIKIGYLAEYDALPEIGHGCGHNILGTTSIGAGILLKEYIDEFGGEVLIFGTPAEETFGAKVDMAEAGCFDDIDVAMISHPTGKNHEKSGTSQAMEALQFTFRGKTAHAAGDPYNGINALDGVIQFFNSINALRQQTKTSARIHGIISNGGEAANIIPDLAVANFYVREATTKEMLKLSERVKNCAKGAALATGTSLEIENYEYTFKHLVTNEKLSSIYTKNLELQGIKDIPMSDPTGSSDCGDVSHHCPTIHTYFPISKCELTGHSIEFAKATITEEAYQGMKEAIFALVMTGKDILENENLLKEIKDEFNQMKKTLI
ncbi:MULTISPECIES: M20 family metallopeptidase [Fusobacterium]|uniref:M20 family metallopeptidase n=1 Tax=Fusobacterium TaxID=848 RepID=UPI001F3E3066|nr:MULTISPECIES: M20 family metallopeptidase [Fusobacterium]MCF2612455.1 M20 family metallopeptidase [Fusobacterium perfoetens]MDY2981197.1 M20 family metallopeptidase [Fusobacterium sp.]